ncbi:MAG TPA: hypothetical protein VM243_10065 [Phycisphaerae bacterium]|nr:hypothetical protein [Acidobacteriota bacterium]HUU83837.1 hypothetical protein [Phycisphaerae bacterium]
MPTDSSATPRQYKGVMVSSTFTDLKEHHQALLHALRKENLHAIGVEDCRDDLDRRRPGGTPWKIS